MTITDGQLLLFWELFRGRADAYGTYDSATGRAWQVKEPVTAKVIRAHLQGQHPFGVYLLDGERIHAIAADFDQDDPHPLVQFRRTAQASCLPVYLEQSKSKSYHAWTFFSGADGVPAAKARRVFLHLLCRIGRPQTEVFPKQDRLDDATCVASSLRGPSLDQPAEHDRPTPNIDVVVNAVHVVANDDRPSRFAQTIESRRVLNRFVSFNPPHESTVAVNTDNVANPARWLSPIGLRSRQ